MPTIKDIAVRAGVSHGTVSNVLNKRGNVSAEKIQLVEQAARELGYQLNAQAQQLRAGVTKKVCVILPEIGIRRYSDFYTGLERGLHPFGFDIELICTDHLAHNEKTAAKKALSLNPAALVIISSMVRNKGFYTEGNNLIFVERKPKNLPADAMTAVFDYEKAGHDMAEQCVKKGYKNIALLCGAGQSSNRKTFMNGAVSVLDDSNCEYRICSTDDELSLLEAFSVLNEKDDFDAVIAGGEEDVKYLKKALEYCPNHRLPHIYALYSKTMDPLEGVEPYFLNYRLLGRRTAEYITEMYQKESEEQKPVQESACIRLENDGFLNDPNSAFRERIGDRAVPQIHTSGEETLHFLTIQNATSQAIRLLLPKFQQETGIRVNLISVAYDELHTMAKSCCQGSFYDLIRIDMAWLAELGDRLYRPLDEKESEIQALKARTLPGLDQNYSRIGEQFYAFPLDACVQMLFYRKDLFENELIKREFFETCKKKLEVPSDFEAYNEIARFFSRRFNPDSPTRFGTAVTYGRTFLAGCDFLPRYRASGKSIFDSKGRVDIINKEMEAAFKNYLDTCACSDGGVYQWWQESARCFMEGNAAMYIVFSNYASPMLYDSGSRIIGKVGYANVPGGQPLLGGGAVGISAYSSRYESCLRFLKWLYRRDIADMVCYMGGYICSRDMGENLELQERYPWLEHMEQNFARGWRHYINEQNHSFNEFQFEDVLGKAIRSAASGILDWEAALKKAQLECDRLFG
nr:extracellular solute-binding protein [uncultured Enterocloster sp.]